MEDALKQAGNETAAASEEPPSGQKNMPDSTQPPASNTPRETAPQKEGGVIAWIRNLLPAGSGRDEHDEDSLRDAIEELMEEQDDSPRSSVATHERRLISNILQLRDLPVVDVMVPRADIVAISIDASKEELFALLAQRPHSRLPVYKQDLDNIVGAINMKDIVANLATQTPFEVRDLMRDVLVVSPAMRVMDLMLQMRQSKMHIAFVVDEHGGIDGLITINDLVEAIVGEIDDEYEFDISPQFIERPDGSAIADARYPLEDFESQYGDLFSENEEHEDIDTLGGLINYLAGHVPSRGEVILHSSGVEFDIIDADPRRVMRVRIRNLPKKDGADAGAE
jgi:CBS domain containing-hemolysin-like protein